MPGVLAALTVGAQGAIAREDWALFRDTGVAHLMSISGLHVTMFAWLAQRLVGAAWRHAGRRWPGLPLRLPAPSAAALGGIALATAYALLAGWGVPAQRTLLMLAVVQGLRLQGATWPWPVAWLAAMAAVLALEPLALLQPGFWLSFVAVGILFAADPGCTAAGFTATPVWRRALGAVRGLLAEQAVVTVALAPLTLWLFAQVSLVGLVANLFAVPWVTVVVTPLALLGLPCPPSWDLAAWAVGVLLQGLEPLARWPGAVLQRPIAPWPLAAAAVLGGILLVQRWPWVLRAAGLLLAWPAFVWAPPRPPVGEFEVMAIDVGQGSAVLVRTARHSLLYDTGPTQGEAADAGERIVVPLLRALGEVLDAVVVSHADADHAGGVAAVAAAQPRARWLASFADEPERRCVAGQYWVWDGVRFEVVHPWPRDYGPRGEPLLEDNAMSCVLRITHAAGHESAWLTGDIDAGREVRLALAMPEARASLWVAPHHGSRTSSTPAWLNVLRPRHVVVQAGYRNRFGHPAPVVLARYRQRGIPWVVSSSCGAAIWRSDVPGRVRCWRDEHRRYWHWRPAGTGDEPSAIAASPG
jgi:competence protein ComEC